MKGTLKLVYCQRSYGNQHEPGQNEAAGFGERAERDAYSYAARAETKALPMGG